MHQPLPTWIDGTETWPPGSRRAEQPGSNGVSNPFASFFVGTGTNHTGNAFKGKQLNQCLIHQEVIKSSLYKYAPCDSNIDPYMNGGATGIES